MTAQATSATAINDTARMLTRAKRLARKVLAAKDAQDAAKKDIEGSRGDLAWLAQELGMSTIEAVPGRGVQIVRPVGRRVSDEQVLIRALERYRPELLDAIAPATRGVDIDALSRALEGGEVPATWRKHIEEYAGTVQLRAVVVK